ncbi:m3.1L/R [Myxoma virus]|nr:m3.1 [Myxoma virus]AGU99844.1 m3.1L/R [Myxoma virus]
MTFYVRRDDFGADDSVLLAVQDYLRWSATPFRDRESAGRVFAVFESFKRDASIVFRDNVRRLVLCSYEHVDGCEALIRTMICHDSYLTEACAVIGLLAKVAEYWGYDNPIPTSARVIELFRRLIADYELSHLRSVINIRLQRLCSSERRDD